MSTIVTIAASDQISNSRSDINTNFSNLNTDKIETSVLDTDTALTANSDSKIATQKATKAYADALLGQFTSAKSGVSAGPASSSTQTITHGLGRTPIIIRLHALGNFTAGGSEGGYSSSHGTWNSAGNRCVYMVGGGGSNDAATSSTYSIRIGVTDEANNGTGIVQNVTSTSFDIVWTVSAALTGGAFIWEAN